MHHTHQDTYRQNYTVPCLSDSFFFSSKGNFNESHSSFVSSMLIGVCVCVCLNLRFKAEERKKSVPFVVLLSTSMYDQDSRLKSECECPAHVCHVLAGAQMPDLSPGCSQDLSALVTGGIWCHSWHQTQVL